MFKLFRNLKKNKIQPFGNEKSETEFKLKLIYFEQLSGEYRADGLSQIVLFWESTCLKIK